MILKLYIHDALKDKIKKKYKLHEGQITVFMPKGSTVRDLLLKMELPDDWVGLIIVNNKQVNFEQVLHDKDVINIFTPMSGG